MVLRFLLILSTVVTESLLVPLNSRCFNEGITIASKTMDHGLAELCVKDDISMIKITSTQTVNTSTFINVVTRKMIIQNYEECNPIEVSNGPIMIFKPDEHMILIPHTYACRVECTISLDEAEANIVLHSDKLNHFELMGTTTANKWFQGSTSYSLEHTCEHIQVTCGPNSLSFHACFKQHMACVRLLNKSYMPAFMISSICRNKELILLTCFTLIIFSLLYLATFTYICYLLLIVFLPIAYLYGKIYDRACKKCFYCGLAYHPFSKCGQNCVCGSFFENSDRMKAHRVNGLCKGYKSMTTARAMCKSKGPTLVLACITAFLFLSFIQPLEAVKLQYNNEIIEIDEVTAEFDAITQKLDEASMGPILIASLSITSLIILILVIYLRQQIESTIFRKTYHYCDECKMLHAKKGLRYYFNGEFTNKCNSCACGIDYNKEMDGTNDYMIPMDHEISERCFIPGRYKAIRKMENITVTFIIGALTIILLISTAYASDDKCIKIKESKSISEPVECSIWYKIPTSCASTSNLIDVFKSLQLPDGEVEEITKLSAPLSYMLLDSEQATSPFKSYLLEEAALKTHCKEVSNYDSKTGKFNRKMQSLLMKDMPDACENRKSADICKCFKGESSCSTTGETSDAISYYKNHHEILKSDITKIINALIETYPGLLAKELGLSMKMTNLSKLKTIATKMLPKVTHADTTKACYYFLEKILTDTTLSSLSLKDVKSKKPLVPYKVNWSSTNIFASIQAATKTKECASFAFYRCLRPISLRMEFFITCNNENNKFHKVPEYGYAPKSSNVQILCVGDPYCDLEFIPITDAEKNKLESYTCTKDTTALDFKKTNPISKCRKMSTQTCSYKGQNKTFMECDNGFFYEYNTGVYQAPGEDIGVYCFDKSCRGVVTPHHIKNLENCKPHAANMKARRLKEIVYENIEQLKHSIQEVIKTDLIEHKYALTKDLPKIFPSFKAISIMGTETDSGIENSYIETNLIVRAGISTGVTISTKKGEPLFDLIIFIKTAHYEAVAEHIYTTGPTIGINVQHDEMCTGNCPKNLAKQNWLSFSKEHTSHWGCEEFGCLAIDEGCVFGHCQDIIKPELRVLKKVTEENPKVTICMTLPSGSYCQDINSFNPIISEKMEVQFISNEAGRIPKIFGYKSNKVLTGMINDLGTFSKMCGSVQSTTNVNGAGVVRFDYICHAARRKEVVVSKCFDNFYDSCNHLTKEKDLLYDDKTNKIISLNKLLGEIKIKLKLGDINYKLFEKKPNFDLKASCVGCVDCIKGFDCELTILATADTVCPLSSNCQTSHNNMHVQANVQKYGIKAFCQTEEIHITICEQSVEIQPTIINKEQAIEVGNSDQTYYVKEHDLKCGTWLCKITEQGIGSIFAPFFSIFGEYGKIAFYSVLAIILLALVCYLLIPVCGRLKDFLKNNEVEYIRENFGYKPRRK